MNEVAIRSVTELTDIYGMRVLVRASLDVSIQNGVVRNEFRVLQSLPTLKHLIERGARVIILTHIGRDAENSTYPLLEILKKHIPVTYVDGVVGEEVRGAIAHMKEGSALLLENVRRHTEEVENDETFAKTLASYADFYVNDAFAVAHRAHASIVGIPRYLPRFGGISFLKEYSELSKVLTPDHPSLFILGGAKYETKQPLIEKFAHMYTCTFIGGALANDFLKGKGYEVGNSLVSPVDLRESPLLKAENILLPTDVVVAKGDTVRTVAVGEIEPHERILDVGVDSLEALAVRIREAKTILWNGPLGYYEGGYDSATKTCARYIAENQAFSVVGGGDTVSAIESLGLEEKFGFLSTAGGAMLEYLEKQTLPGITALEK